MKVGVITASWVYRLSGYDGTTPWGVAQGRFEQSWTSRDLDELLATVKSLGFDYVELWRGTTGFEKWDDEQLSLVRDSLSRHDLQIASYCVGGIGSDSDIEGLFAYANGLGARMCTGYLSNAEAEALAGRIADACRRYGMRYGVENHGREYSIADPEDILGLAERYPGLIGACPDTGGYHRDGSDPVAAVQALREVTVHTHLKDLDEDGACALGEGRLPMAEIVAALRDAGYSGVYSVEREGGGDPGPLLERSARFLRRMLSA